MLLAEEPTGSLDSRSGEDILNLLLSLNREGQTVLLVTHARELAEIAGRLITLRDGEIVSDEELGPSRSENANGHVVIAAHPGRDDQ